MRRLKVLALPKYGDSAASMRQRLKQYVLTLETEGYEVEISSLLGDDHIRRMNSGLGPSAFNIVLAYIKRFLLIISSHKQDVIWLHYESFPYLPSFAERLIFLSGKPVVLDFDDAIYHQYDDHRNTFVRTFLSRKLQALMRGCAVCAVGNAYLADYAKRFCSDVRILPTVVDTGIYKPASIRKIDSPITIGWIGTPSTWNFVKPLVPSLQLLARRPGVLVKIIGAGRIEMPPVGLDFVEWSEDSEIADIQSMDIGIMPLPDELWARGKCGYKLIQYMACGLPVVASPVGVNSTIVEHGVNGYLAESLDEFKVYIEQLLVNQELRSIMGSNGRLRVESDYSLKAHAPRFVKIIDDAINSKCVE